MQSKRDIVIHICAGTALTDQSETSRVNLHNKLVFMQLSTGVKTQKTQSHTLSHKSTKQAWDPVDESPFLQVTSEKTFTWGSVLMDSLGNQSKKKLCITT